MKSVFRETADADNQQKRRTAFRNLLRRRQRQSHTRLRNLQPRRRAKFSMAEVLALSKFQFQGLDQVRKNTSAENLQSVERRGPRPPKAPQSHGLASWRAFGSQRSAPNLPL